MSDIRTRLAKLERAASASLTNCPGCVVAENTGTLVLVRPRQPELPEASNDVLIRCAVCGRERIGLTVVMRVLGPRRRQLEDVEARLSAAARA